ncbi:hypothetical protein AVEN_177889-1 [Araneus ventricosus]|uniref:Uncharacterized protein n=1 Tax=Araneus ventricosus TaxID=182803 RepID=A0A4Y2LDZ1_ARAVE|nr:hypothetical protein AVEN_177889-1 [Araneus ventricosus]
MNRKKIIDNLDPEDLVDNIEESLREKLTELNDFSDTTIEAKLQYGKKLRNSLTLEHWSGLIDIIKDLCDKVRSRDATIFDLQGDLTDCDLALMRAKIWSLEKEKSALQAKS